MMLHGTHMQSCDVCARRMSAGPKARAPLKERQQATQPLEKIEIDIKGPLPKTERRSIYIGHPRRVLSICRDACYLKTSDARSMWEIA